MGMTMSVEALIPTDSPEWQRHAAVYRACMAAEVTLPKKTAKALGISDYECDELKEWALDATRVQTMPVRNWQDPDGDRIGFEVSVKDIPAGVSILRFYCSW